MTEFLIANMAPIMFASLIVFLMFGYAVSFSLAACGLFFGFVGVELGVIQATFLQSLPLRMFGIMQNDTLLAIPFFTFIARVQEVLPMHDIWVGLIKAPVFGFIIALAGCFQGMLVKSDAEEVGLRTTAAVVQSIFMVIVLDAVFAVIFQELGL